jgi:hypothetical protein
MDCLLNSNSNKETLIGYCEEPSLKTGEAIKLRVKYYSGWNWISPKCNEVTKDIECIILGSIKNTSDIYIFTKEPQMFSWGNGITVPSNLFVLLENNELGYLYKDLNEPLRWSKCIPKWELI